MNKKFDNINMYNIIVGNRIKVEVQFFNNILSGLKQSYTVIFIFNIIIICAIVIKWKTTKISTLSEQFQNLTYLNMVSTCSFKT